jgi:ATP-binding cassette subfamily C protein CydD
MKLDRRLLDQATAARMALVASVGCGLLVAIATVVMSRFLSLVVSRVFLDGFGLEQVRPWLVALVVVSIARAGLVWGREMAANSVATRVKHDLRSRLATHLFDLGPAYTHGERSGELTNTAVQGVEALDAYFRQYLPQVALAALIPLTILVFVFPLDWVSGLILVVTAPLIPLFMVLIGNLADSLTKRQWASLSRMSAHFLDVLQGLATLKLLGRSKEQTLTIARVSARYREATMGVLRVAFLSALTLEMLATVSTAIVAVAIGLRLLAGTLSFEQGLFVLLLAPEFYLPLRALGARFHAGMQGVSAARRIFDVLDTPIPSPRTQAVTQVGPISPSFHLRFVDIHYAYDDGLRPALNGISFEIQPGEKVALVGPSGAGKSTVLYHILRFIEADRGAITVDGHPLQDFPREVWRKNVAWVPQEPYLFYGTVADNIRLGDPGATQDRVVWAARQAQAHEFILALPDGYASLVGERGARLSGGEAQRIALARAFLKDTPMLVLDEATANLDPENEALLQEAMGRLLAGRTALMIAHRLNTVARADRILVMNNGRIVQQGSHSVLQRDRGLYSDLFTAYHSGAAT